MKQGRLDQGDRCKGAVVAGFISFHPLETILDLIKIADGGN